MSSSKDPSIEKAAVLRIVEQMLEPTKQAASRRLSIALREKTVQHVATMSRAPTAATTERIVATIALFLSACGGDGASSSTGLLPTDHTPSSLVATTDTLLQGIVVTQYR